MFRLENRAGTLIFMLRHFDQMIGQTTILILYALLLLLTSKWLMKRQIIFICID